MTEIIQPIPARIKNVAIGGHVAGTEDIIDDNLGKTQQTINQEVDNKIEALTKQDIEVVNSLPAVSTADPKKIYRVSGTTSYTDYMLNPAGSAFSQLATFSFPGIDDEPVANSNNFVKSGGVLKIVTESESVVPSLSGYIKTTGELIASVDWCHTPAYKVEWFNSSSLQVNTSVANIAFYSSDVISQGNFLGYLSQNAITKADFIAAMPTGATHFVASTDVTTQYKTVNLQYNQVDDNTDDIATLKSEVKELEGAIGEIDGDTGYVTLDLTTGFYKSDLTVDTNTGFRKAIVDVSKALTLEITASVRSQAYILLTDENDNILWSSNANVADDYSRTIDLHSFPTATKLYLSNETSKVATPTVEILTARSLKQLVEDNTEAIDSIKGVVSKRMHISFDDTIGSLYDLYSRNRTSLFDSPFFSVLKQLHAAYGCVFSCYCFLEYLDNDQETVLYKLSDIPNTWATEFSANSDWLRFGFHSKNNYTNYVSGTAAQATEDYEDFITEIIRITGSVDCIDTVVRLQNFAGNLISCQSMRDASCGLTGLLTSDASEITGDGGTSGGYYLTGTIPAKVWNKGVYYDYEQALHFFPSNKRLDNIASANLTAFLNKFLTVDKWAMGRMAIMYCHENQMFNYSTQIVGSSYLNSFNILGTWANQHGFAFRYPMDEIGL